VRGDLFYPPAPDGPHHGGLDALAIQHGAICEPAELRARTEQLSQFCSAALLCAALPACCVPGLHCLCRRLTKRRVVLAWCRAVCVVVGRLLACLVGCDAFKACYGITMLFGSLCLTLQFLPDLPGDIIWIPGTHYASWHTTLACLLAAMSSGAALGCARRVLLALVYADMCALVCARAAIPPSNSSAGQGGT
jgi:hypothetical protein